MVGAFNVFARRQTPALRCAVRQDYPVPSFIDPEIWEFCSTVTDVEPIPIGFQPNAAQEAMQLIGYYLYTALGRAPVLSSAE